MTQASEIIAKQYAAAGLNKFIWGGLGVNVRDMGAVGDGVTDDTNAFYKAISSITGEGAIIIPPGTYRIASSLTIPSNVCAHFVNGGMIAPGSGATVTINGEIIAELTQIFAGLGAIMGSFKVPCVYLEWWGAKGDGVTDDTVAMQKAVDYANSIGKHEIWMSDGIYKYTAITNTTGIVFVGDGVILDGTTDLVLTSIAELKASAGNSINLEKTLFKLTTAQAVKIVCLGDSITAGTSQPYPLVLQTKLRNRFAYDNITVINEGHPGERTDTAVANFDEYVVSHNPDLVIIMYGVNDSTGYTGIVNSPEQYRNNISGMINKAIKNNIEVLLMTPTPIFVPQDYVARRIQLYAETVKVTAEQFSISYVDLQDYFHKIIEGALETPDSLYDPETNPSLGPGTYRVHFKTDKYFYIADMVLGKMLDYNSRYKTLHLKENVELNVPVVGSPYVQTDCNNVISDSHSIWKNSYLMNKTNTVGTYIIFKFYADVPNMDLVLVAPKSYFGGLLAVYDNGVLVRNVDFYSIDNRLYDTETTIISGISPGYHNVEFVITNLANGQSTQGTNICMMFTAFKFKPKKQNVNIATSTLGTNYGSIEQFKRINNGLLKYYGGQFDYTTMILTSCDHVELLASKTLVFEVEGKFYLQSGIIWFGNKAGGDSNTKGYNNGYVFRLNANTVELFGPSGLNGAISSLGSYSITLDFTKTHLIRVTHSSAGVITVFIDGTQTVTATNTVANSGYFGFYSAEASTSTISMDISRYEYAYK